MKSKTTQEKPPRQAGSTGPPPRRPLSMHEEVPTWCDCCSCEPEPRWQAVEEQLERDRQQNSPRGGA